LEEEMKKQLMAVALAGSLGTAGLLVPQLASAQGADATGPGAAAGPGGGGRMGRMHHGAGRWEEGGGMMHGELELGPIWRLDLSDAQRADLRKIAGDYRRANWATIGNLIDARAKLRELESASQPDPKQVGTSFAEVSRLRQILLQAGIQARNQAVAALTPDQRKQLDQWRTQGPGPHRGFRGRGPGMMAP
jgi:Spy/CpxP family protein refolding chaperone